MYTVVGIEALVSKRETFKWLKLEVVTVFLFRNLSLLILFKICYMNKILFCFETPVLCEE